MPARLGSWWGPTSRLCPHMAFLGLCPGKQGCFPGDHGQWGNQMTRVNCAVCRNPLGLSDAEQGLERNSLSTVVRERELLECIAWKAASFPQSFLHWNLLPGPGKSEALNLNYKMYRYGISSNILLKKWKENMRKTRKPWGGDILNLVGLLSLSPLVILRCIWHIALNYGACFFLFFMVSFTKKIIFLREESIVPR